ncbi:MAG: hypothetical protein RIS17_38 [Pseudomonadota bacterium]
MKFAATISFLMLATPALAVTAQGGAVHSAARVVVGGATDQTHESDTAVGLPGLLASAAFVTLNDAGSTISVFSSMRATWTSATRGQAEMQWGWDARNAASLSPTLVETIPPDMASWSYRFTTGSTPGRFQARWTLETAGDDTLGIQGVYGDGGLPFTVTPFRTAPESDTGMLSVDLAPNQSYALEFFNYGNLERDDRGLDSFASARFLLDWEITTATGVPEPQSWAMMIAGFGLVGAASRRKQRNYGARGRI